MVTTSRREDLLDIAAELFAEKGYANTSVRDIASRMGILSGSVYSHVESKVDLLIEIYVRATTTLSKLIRPVVLSDLPALEKIRTALRLHTRAILEDGRLLIMWSSEWRQMTDEKRDIVLLARAEYLDLWGSMIQQGMDEGYLRRVNPNLARIILMAAPTHAISRYGEEMVGEYESPDDLADLIYDLTVRGLHA